MIRHFDESARRNYRRYVFYNLKILTSKLLIFVILQMTLLGCIDIIDFEINEKSNQLVVIGEITTLPGPYEVKLSKATDFDTPSYERNNIITDAEVFITVNDGQMEKLTHRQNGSYFTGIDGIKGEIGKTYSLTIITKDKAIYQSTSELIVESPSIDSIYFEYEVGAEFINDVQVPQRHVNIYIDTSDDPSTNNYYSWSWLGTYKFLSYPELFVINRTIVPLPCSYDGCSCCLCWVTSNEQNELSIKNDQFNNGNNIYGQLVGQIPITGRHVQFKYYIKVFQRTLSKKAYDFWSLVKDQQTSNSLAATPPAQIIGNIKNINDPEEIIWGYFSASDLKNKTTFFSIKDFPNYEPIANDTLKNDCRILPNSTTEIPVYW
ncbi:MAG: DUF4249 domain-containing protein [Reichenbachiella sp.]